MMAKYDFVKKANEIHKDKYDYSKVDYINKKTKVCIICPEHGEFWQTPEKHIDRAQGCPKCSGRGKTTEDIIEDFRKIHGDKYDYSKVDYKKWNIKVCIICPEHGEFWQTPNCHKMGQGCPKCGGHMRSNNEDFIRKANMKHHFRYNYEKVNYINNQTKVCIICPEHGEFYMRPNHHLKGIGCPKCSDKYHMSTDEYIEKANRIHSHKYDYSETVYINNKSNVYIICPKHGGFWQNAKHHLKGSGCPLCCQSHLERDTEKFLVEKEIKYEREKRFEWLGRQRLDFYLPEYNSAIECQGIQHFKPVSFGGNLDANELFKQIRRNDERKKLLCLQNGIKLFYVNFDEDIVNKLNNVIKKIC